MPLLFHWHTGGQNQPISVTTICRALEETLEFVGLTENTGQLLDHARLLEDLHHRCNPDDAELPRISIVVDFGLPSFSQTAATR